MAKKKPGSSGGGRKRKRVTSRVVNPQNTPASPPAAPPQHVDTIVHMPSTIVDPPQLPPSPPLSLFKWLKMLDWAWYSQLLIWLCSAGLIAMGLFHPVFIWKVTLVTLGAVVLVLGLAMFFNTLRTITTDPPHKGLLTVWGDRLPKVIDEGDRFLAEYFPFNRGAIQIKVETINKDFEVPDIPANKLANDVLTDIPTRNGRAVFEPEVLLKARITVTFEPDADRERPYRLIEYHQIGQVDGVVNNLNQNGLIGNFLRSLGAINREAKMCGSVNEVRLYLIRYLTGRYPGQPGDPIDSATLINEMRDKGFPDVHRLGIVLKRIDINELYYQSPAVRDAVDKVKQEQFEAESEKRDVETGLALAEKYKSLGMNGKEAVDRAQADRSRAQRVSVSIEGLSEEAVKNLAPLVNAVQQIRGQTQGGKNPGKKGSK